PKETLHIFPSSSSSLRSAASPSYPSPSFSPFFPARQPPTKPAAAGLHRFAIRLLSSPPLFCSLPRSVSFSPDSNQQQLQLDSSSRTATSWTAPAGQQPAGQIQPDSNQQQLQRSSSSRRRQQCSDQIQPATPTAATSNRRKLPEQQPVAAALLRDGETPARMANRQQHQQGK
ncbi:hypothetical protein AABB24_018692, partial [Solanum stoloniferum]